MQILINALIGFTIVSILYWVIQNIAEWISAIRLKFWNPPSGVGQNMFNDDGTLKED
jgi:hypothetical protein